MISAKIVRALLKMSEVLEPKKVAWAVDGSTALALQGIDITPADLDILSDREGAYRISRLFAGAVVAPVRYRKSVRFWSHFGEMKIEGVKVEVMGNLRVFQDGKWSKVMSPSTRKIKWVKVERIKIPVVSLAALRETGYLQRRLEEERMRRRDS